MDLKALIQPMVCEVIAPSAAETDRNALFPQHALNALADAGLLGLTTSKDVGGMGLGLAEAAFVVESIATACPSTAMVVTMHYAANAVLENYASEALRRDIASGKHLSTLAWSETGFRSHFWAPVGTAQVVNDGYVLNGSKTMIWHNVMI